MRFCNDGVPIQHVTGAGEPIRIRTAVPHGVPLDRDLIRLRVIYVNGNTAANGTLLFSKRVPLPGGGSAPRAATSSTGSGQPIIGRRRLHRGRRAVFGLQHGYGAREFRMYRCSRELIPARLHAQAAPRLPRQPDRGASLPDSPVACRIVLSEVPAWSRLCRGDLDPERDLGTHQRVRPADHGTGARPPRHRGGAGLPARPAPEHRDHPHHRGLRHRLPADQHPQGARRRRRNRAQHQHRALRPGPVRGVEQVPSAEPISGSPHAAVLRQPDVVWNEDGAPGGAVMDRGRPW